MDSTSERDPFIVPHGHISAGVRGGRNPRDGYDRSCGLKYRGLVQKISEQPDFQEAAAIAHGRSIVSPDRLMNLYMLIRLYLPKIGAGQIVEYGSFKGGSAMFMAKLAQRYLPNTKVYGLDTFQGLPAPNSEIDGLPAGEFASSYDEVTGAAKAAGLDNLHFVRGLFSDTAPAILQEAGKLAMIHIDCDLYEPVSYAYEISKPFMVPGGYLVFDDATEGSCLGATEAVESLLIRRDGLHAEQIDPHFVFRYPALAG